MKLRAPGDAALPHDHAPSRLFGPTTTADRAYQAFADVTSIVQAAGPGTYFGADVPAATGEDRHAGWSLVVVYRSPSLPLRNLTVFDGLADVGQNDPQSITISGFTHAGHRHRQRPHRARRLRGRPRLDRRPGDPRTAPSWRTHAVAGHQLLQRHQRRQRHARHGADAGRPQHARLRHQELRRARHPRQQRARRPRIDLASTSERYFPGVVTTAIDVFAPDFSPSTKTVTNLTGGDPARVGDTLRYTVTFVNAGQDPAINTSIDDPIPAGHDATCPGSLDVPAGVTGSFDPAPNTRARVARQLPGRRGR